MMKTVGLLPRRMDWPRRRFRDYYESRHAPLALCYFPFRKYVRNHLIDNDDIGFDTISEFWAEDLAQLGALMQGPVGEAMREDERRFMHRPHIRSAASVEKLLAGPAREIDEIDRRKLGLLLKRPQEIAAATFAATAEEFGRAIATANQRTVVRVSIDVLTAWGDDDFPFDAVLWLWLEDGDAASPTVKAPPGVTLWKTVNTEALETPTYILDITARGQAQMLP